MTIQQTHHSTNVSCNIVFSLIKIMSSSNGHDTDSQLHNMVSIVHRSVMKVILDQI